MDRYVRYYGWIGRNNIGDEAIYLANGELFSDFELLDHRQVDPADAGLGLVGGGTVVPAGAWSLEDVLKTRLQAAIGVGVREPEFWNQKFSRVDMSHYANRFGVSETLRRAEIQYLLRPIAWSSDSVAVSDHHVDVADVRPLSRFFAVGVRGPRSKATLKKWGIDATVTGDTALLLEPSEYHTDESKRIAVVLRESGPKWGDSRDYQAVIREFLNSRAGEYRFVFLPFRPQDIQLHLDMARTIDGAAVKDYCTHVNVRGVLDELAECDLVIGERLHASVLSACAHTPFISLEYRPKNRDFADSLGMSHYNRRIDRVSSEYLDKTVDEIAHNDALSVQLAKEVEAKRDALSEFASEVIGEYRK